jgi:pyruvate kinase
MRKTKIVATIGPASESSEMIERMIEAGVDVFRFNMKHNDLAWHSEKMELVERVCRKLGVRAGILMDLQGPEIRIDTVPEEYREISEGDQVWFCKAGKEGVSLDHPEIFGELAVGQQVYADDGFLEFEIVSIEADRFEAKVIDGGVIKPRKTVNFPGMHLNFRALIDRDIEHLSLAAQHHVDFVALSFVRSADDIELLRKELENHAIHAQIIAKIEHPDAVERFEEVLQVSDGIMVARGDLGIEYPMEEVPVLQKMIVRRCQAEGKPVIIATQMLESMITNSRPTRAEVSDVANAVYDGADAIMLSAESAAGKYPVRAVKMMGTIAKKAEEVAEYRELEIDWKRGGQTAAVVAAAYQLMQYGYKGVCDLKAYVVLTETGRTVRYLTRMRPQMPIYALSSSENTLDQMKLLWGANPVHYDYKKQPQMVVTRILEIVKEAGWVQPGDKVVVIHGEQWGKSGLTSVVRIQEVV